MLVQLQPQCCIKNAALGLNLEVDHEGATNRLTVACYGFARVDSPSHLTIFWIFFTNKQTYTHLDTFEISVTTHIYCCCC